MSTIVIAAKPRRKVSHVDQGTIYDPPAHEMSDAPSPRYQRARRALMGSAVAHLGIALEATGRKGNTAYVIVRPTRTSGNIDFYELAIPPGRGDDYLRGIRQPFDLRSSQPMVKRSVHIGGSRPHDEVVTMRRGRPVKEPLTEEVIIELNDVIGQLRIDRH